MTAFRKTSAMTRFAFPAMAMVSIACLLAACAGIPNADPVAAIDHSDRMRGYVESRRVTDFCPDQNQRRDDERCVVTYGWDYERGVTVVRTFDPAGKVIAT